MSELHHECGVAAIYHLGTQQQDGPVSDLSPPQGPAEISRLMPRMLLDIQNRGQLSAGMTTYNPARQQLIDTHRKLGTVSEAFRLNHRGKCESLMQQYAGCAAIGHVRYATCGKEDESYAQPFERHHLQKHKWFSFAFNGQLANYAQLRDKLLAEDDHHLARATDTEIIMHEISRELSGDRRMPLIDVMRHLATRFDGAYSLALLNAQGQMLIARDPLGVKPMCYAIEGSLLAAASESVALLNLGFQAESIKSLEPGTAIVVNGNEKSGKEITIERFSDNPRRAHCFFEWIYFANVASNMDGRSVYLSRKALGEELALLEDVPRDEDTIVVPVPDTSKAAADAMAYKLGIPSIEGLIRNRYSGRTFIEGGANRKAKAAIKYTPLPEVLAGKRVLLVEDSIVRSTTMRVLISKIREVGRAKEIHVRVACPPITAPCFYGIDMSTISELFAPAFLPVGNDHLAEGKDREAMFAEMAEELGADSVRFLPVESIARAIEKPVDSLCQACLTGEYPTAWGQKLYDIALTAEKSSDDDSTRTYEVATT
ncbi:amidophosphoribosyltransferase [Adhaeretor mobilis]|uniref:Amidophosphoribosyltransferase n=1 Tax=Adhaeretor mobilis TaxID=1930276 RepID=A0A517MYM5_9BACT|nr:amidophosphoribosyltransferase [Adhaeretor mobilis]QDS99981.1 Amidophosphoribosyltransferase [Adhaeretor mobilis]